LTITKHGKRRNVGGRITLKTLDYLTRELRKEYAGGSLDAGSADPDNKRIANKYCLYAGLHSRFTIQLTADSSMVIVPASASSSACTPTGKVNCLPT